MRKKKRKKNWGWQLSSWQMFFLGGGKCPNLGVGNVRILGVVNVLLANDSQSHRDRSKDVDQVYCNIFHGVIAASTKVFVIFVSPKSNRRVRKIFVITVSPNTEKWGILEPTTPPTQDPEYNTTIMNWTKFNPCLDKHALLRKHYLITMSGTYAFIYQYCQLKLSFWWVSMAKLKKSCLFILIEELFLLLKIKFIVLLVQESMRRGTSIFRISSVL